MFNERCEEIYNTLRKLKRDASAFLNKRDKELVADFNKNMRTYLRHVDLYELSKAIYDKRQRLMKDREMNKDIIDLSKVEHSQLEEAGVSKREFEHIKLLLALDPELFRPSEYGAFSPYSMLVDISKYTDKQLTKDVKEILYRPPKVKNLYDKYWALAKVCEDRDKEEFDREILTDHKPRYPKKSKEELALIDAIIQRIENLVEEDKRVLARGGVVQQVNSDQLHSELIEGDGKLYYEGAGQEALDKWRAMTEAERQALKSKNDEID